MLRVSKKDRIPGSFRSEMKEEINMAAGIICQLFAASDSHIVYIVYSEDPGGGGVGYRKFLLSASCNLITCQQLE